MKKPINNGRAKNDQILKSNNCIDNILQYNINILRHINHRFLIILTYMVIIITNNPLASTQGENLWFF
jgi:hypothetical protein